WSSDVCSSDLVTGLAMIFGLLSPINSGIWLVIFNIPVFMIGWIRLGKEFIVNSIFSVFITSLSMQYIPVLEITDDALLSAVFGGVFVGVSIGVIVRFYVASGGHDFIGLVVSQK